MAATSVPIRVARPSPRARAAPTTPTLTPVPAPALHPTPSPCSASCSPAAPSLRRRATHTPARALPDISAAAAELAAAAAAAAPDPMDMEAKRTASYVGLGLAALSFVGTFGVLPQFKDLLKEPVPWSVMHQALVQAGNVKALPPADVLAKVRRGAVLLDVRLEERYAGGTHAVRSVSAPLYRPILGWDVASNLRRLAFSLFGIFPATELNPDFISTVTAAVPKGREVVVMCETGGSLETKPGVKFGFQSRSLKAVYFLLQAGYYKVFFCQGGFPQWQREGLPVESSAADDESGGERVGGTL